jgi:hypothetical protein
VRAALTNANQIYEQLKPHERKELMKLLIRSIEVGDEQMVLEIYGTPLAEPGQARMGDSRFESVSWLPDEDSNLEPSD